MGFFISEIRGNNMKAGLKRIISIALTLSLVWGIAGGIAPVTAHADVIYREISPHGVLNQRLSIVNYDISFPGMTAAGFSTSADDINAEHQVELTEYFGFTNVRVRLFEGEKSLTIEGIPTRTGTVYLHCRGESGDIAVLTFTVSEHGCETHTGDWTVSDDGTTHSRTCSICGAEETHAARWSGWIQGENGNHVRSCTNENCSLRETAAHSFANGVCSVCGAEQPSQPSHPEPEPEIDFENSIVPPSLPPSDNVTSEPEAPSEPEDPYAKKQEEANKQLEDTINKFLSAKDRLASTGSSEEFALFTGSYNSGLTLDMGNLTSFKKDTYDKISELVSVGVPVTIKYIHKGENRSLTIPKYCKADLSSYCDETGYIGFENLKGQLIRDKYIEASEEDIAAFTKARDNMQSIFRISQADNAATANSGAGMAPTPINGGFTPFAAFGSSSFRAQSG